MASSDSEATVGMIMMPSTRPAESTLKVPTSSPKRSRSRNGATKVSAK